MIREEAGVEDMSTERRQMIDKEREMKVRKRIDQRGQGHVVQQAVFCNLSKICHVTKELILTYKLQAIHWIDSEIG